MFGKKKVSANPAEAAAVSSVAAAPASGSGELSPEIVAVITAAIAAMTGNGTVSSNLIIRKISRIHGEKVSWSNAGLMECIDSRKI
jgi:hypothetical protein